MRGEDKLREESSERLKGLDFKVDKRERSKKEKEVEIQKRIVESDAFDEFKKKRKEKDFKDKFVDLVLQENEVFDIEGEESII